MNDQNRIQGLISLAAIVVVLVVVAAYTRFHWPFVSPLDVAVSPVYLPLVLRARPAPDGRFGIAEHSLEEMLLLNFPDDGRYHSVQWTQPEKTDTVRFLRPASRDHHSTWLLGAYDTEAGVWVDEAGFRRFVREHDRMIYVVGNELLVGTPIGDSSVSPIQYARWYRDAWELIKVENPTALVGLFAPCGPVSKNKLIDVWREYRVLTGHAMSVDFFPLHRYAMPGKWTLEGEIAFMEGWIGWLNGHNPHDWQWTRGPNYWLTEYGLPAWSDPVGQNDALRYMRAFTNWLKTNELGIEVFVWWPSGNMGWPNRDTWLVKDGQVTELGREYYRLAIEGE